MTKALYMPCLRVCSEREDQSQVCISERILTVAYTTDWGKWAERERKGLKKENPWYVSH